MEIRIAPSILSADFAKLGEQVRETEEAGADRIHVDVMDGHFVPNLSMGPAIVQSLRKITKLPFEIHLMVDDPLKFAAPFQKAGASSIIFHWEACDNPEEIGRQIRALGMKVGVAIKPKTNVEELTRLVNDIDLALCMTVEPGYAGQPFLPESPSRITAIRQAIMAAKSNCDLEVDGGINLETGRRALDAGANVLVAATAIFGHPQGPGAAVREFIRMANGK